MQSVLLAECAAEDLDLVPGARHGGSSEEDGLNAENKLHCMWQIKYLLLDLKPNGGSPMRTLRIIPLSHIKVSANQGPEALKVDAFCALFSRKQSDSNRSLSQRTLDSVAVN